LFGALSLLAKPRSLSDARSLLEIHGGSYHVVFSPEERALGTNSQLGFEAL
jgi:hypothetical protein